MQLLGDDWFTLTEQHRYGIAASEIVRMFGFVMFRWFRPSRDKYRAVSRTAYAVLDAEERLVWKHGFWLEATFTRKK
jgi:hypothetical protein